MWNRIFRRRGNMDLKLQKELIARLPDTQVTVSLPAANWTSKPTPRLLNIVTRAIPIAAQVDHSDIASKMKEYPAWPIIWPGEHYRLLSALVQVLQPKLIIEIGTATGYSLLSMKKYLPPGSRLVTFDIVPWQKVKNCVLTEKDFLNTGVEQVIGDLTESATFEKHIDLLRQADFVFIDAAKDGVQEQLFIDKFRSITYEREPIFMFDDIKMMNMVEIWNNLDLPKWDISSLGHWSGTGLVDWTAKNK